MSSSNRRVTGFTLIEILIVVIILGILAAVVIPQLSHATTDARRSAMASTVQTLRNQVALYRVQHSDKLPDATNFWNLMMSKTDATGAAWTTSSTTGPFGPYMQTQPANALNALSTVLDGTNASTISSSVGFVYDYTGGTGQLWGTDTTGKAIQYVTY